MFVALISFEKIIIIKQRNNNNNRERKKEERKKVREKKLKSNIRKSVTMSTTLFFVFNENKLMTLAEGFIKYINSF